MAYLIFRINTELDFAVEEIERKRLKGQIDNLTIKQLKGTIFHVEKWWLILLINAIVTVIVSVSIALIMYKFGLK